MPLLQSKLATELEALTPTDTEATAVDALAVAWENYFADASVLGIPTTPGSLTAATTVMKGALVGVNTPDQGAQILQDAITAFWGVVASSAASIWITVPPTTGATPPPGLSGIKAALQAVFDANTSGGLSLAASVAAVAAVLHPLQLGGIAQLSGPPAAAPIL